jgi:hypothetical protein
VSLSDRPDGVEQDFDLYGWRCACRGSGNVAAAQHTARSFPAEMPRRAADDEKPHPRNPDDRVLLEISASDWSQGRIVYRYK